MSWADQQHGCVQLFPGPQKQLVKLVDAALHDTVQLVIVTAPAVPLRAISAQTILIKSAFQQSRRQKCLHPLKSFLLGRIRSPGPSLQIEAHGAMEQTNRFKIEIELKSWS